MCDRLGIEIKGSAHQGLTDAIHVAKIAIELVRNHKASLEINQRIVRIRDRPLCLPPPADEEEIKRLSKQYFFKRGEMLNSANGGAKRLPFELKLVSRDEFNTEAYWDCESCDERAS